MIMSSLTRGQVAISSFFANGKSLPVESGLKPPVTPIERVRTGLLAEVGLDVPLARLNTRWNAFIE